MESKKLTNGIIRILIANAINLFFSLGTNFLLPKYVSVDTYAQIKTYQLYISYVAILQLGYSDGMYLAFGGKNIKKIPMRELQKSISTMRVFQFAVALLFTIVACFVGDFVLIVAMIAIFPQNVIAYYKNLFQAVGMFDKYSSTMNYTTGLTFFVNAILLFVIRCDEYLIFIICYLFITVLLCVKLEISIYKTMKTTYGLKYFSIKELIEKVSSGFLLLLANFSSILLTSMDRWFVKFFLGFYDFAQYSFSVSIENFLNVAVSPITVTMYNYFCHNEDKEKIKNVLDLMIGFSALLVTLAFPIKFVIEFYLDKYVDSINIIFLLFAAQIFLIIIRSIYANLYKARKKQKRYFIKMCIVIIGGAVFNYICYLMLPQKEAFAIATLLSSIVWFILCLLDFKDIRFGVPKIVFLFVECFTFLICGQINVIIGFIIYFIITLFMIRVMLPGVLSKYKEIIDGFINNIHRILLNMRGK